MFYCLDVSEEPVWCRIHTSCADRKCAEYYKESRSLSVFHQANRRQVKHAVHWKQCTIGERKEIKTHRIYTNFSPLHKFYQTYICTPPPHHYHPLKEFLHSISKGLSNEVLQRENYYLKTWNEWLTPLCRVAEDWKRTSTYNTNLIF